MSKNSHDPQLLRRARSAWRVMWRRCSDPRHKDWRHYGGRGLRVTEAWISFERFLMDLGPPPSAKHWLGRRDTAAGYCPRNCQWTTRAVQVARRGYCIPVALNGGLPTIAAAARATGMPDMTLRRRLLEQCRPLREAVCTSRLNRRDSMLLVHLGLTLTLPTWARLMGQPTNRLWNRIRNGWPVDEALRRPPGRRNRG